MTENDNVHCCTELPPKDLEDARDEETVETGPSGTLSDVQYLAALRAQTWSNGTVVGVRFLDGDPEIQKKVEKYAHFWEDFANIKFQFGAADAAVRIGFRKGAGSWSRLGKDAKNAAAGTATMNFGWLERDTNDLEYERVVVHEFGHALGFIHEHQNPVAGIPWDKEKVYAWYLRTQGWDRQQVDFNLFRRYEMSTTQFSKFDVESIMLYPIAKEHTINGAFSVGMNNRLSAIDKAWAGTVYPKPVATTTTIAPNGMWVNADISAGGEVDVFDFDVKEAGTYVIETGGNNDSVMALHGPDSDTILAENDDGGLLFWNARIARPLAKGRYLLKVWYYRKTVTGGYTVRVTRTA